MELNVISYLSNQNTDRFRMKKRIIDYSGRALGQRVISLVYHMTVIPEISYSAVLESLNICAFSLASSRQIVTHIVTVAVLVR